MQIAYIAMCLCVPPEEEAEKDDMNIDYAQEMCIADLVDCWNIK